MSKKVLIKILKFSVCFLLSFVLVLGIVAVPFYYSITALTKPETVTKVIQEVDYKRIIQKNPAIKKTLAKHNITPVTADTIMKSKQTGKLIEIYVDEVTRIFLDIPDGKKLDVPYIKELVKNNTNKFLDITEENTNLKFKRKGAQQNVNEFFKKNEELIEESVETIEEVRNVVKTIYTTHVLEKKLSFWIAFAIIACAFMVIGIIIILIRSNGFLLVGLDFALSSSLLCFIIAFCKSKFITDLALKMSDFGTQIVESAISISVEKITTAALGSLILMMLFITFYVTIMLLKRKYQKETYIQIKGEVQP